MIEYLYDAIRATAGEDITIAASITDENGNIIADACALMLHSDTDMIANATGVLNEGVWEFTIPATITADLKGRYWYCICQGQTKLCFKQPIYLI